MTLWLKMVGYSRRLGDENGTEMRYRNEFSKDNVWVLYQQQINGSVGELKASW
jgi:hypothetical protein